MGYDGGRDGFVDGTVEANNAFLFFFYVNKIISQQAREGGGGGGEEGVSSARGFVFCATLIEDEVVGGYCVLPLGVGRRYHLFVSLSPQPHLILALQSFQRKKKKKEGMGD